MGTSNRKVATVGHEWPRHNLRPTDFQLVIDALKLNGLDTIYGCRHSDHRPDAPRAGRGLRCCPSGTAERGYAASIAGFLTQKPGICLTVSGQGS